MTSLSGTVSRMLREVIRFICVSCVVLCVVVRVAAGQLVARIICGDGGDGRMLGSEIPGDFGVAQ